MALGTDTVVLLAGGSVALLAVVVLAVVITPWRGLRNEPPLDEDVETRLLLGEDPTAVAADVDEAESRRAGVPESDADGSDEAR
jgi:hypothetical protein